MCCGSPAARTHRQQHQEVGICSLARLAGQVGSGLSIARSCQRCQLVGMIQQLLQGLLCRAKTGVDGVGRGRWGKKWFR